MRTHFCKSPDFQVHLSMYKIILLPIALVFFNSCFSNVHAAEKVERFEYNKSAATACSEATDEAKLAVKNHCRFKGGVQEYIGSGCKTKDVSKAWNGRPMYKSTVTYSVICNGKQERPVRDKENGQERSVRDKKNGRPAVDY